MKPNSFLYSIIGALCAGICLTFATARAQSTPDEQAKVILQLFESGQKDSAYALLEPLKKTARFVPAVIYTRAQMTPDDRALSLYKELIALDPKGEWADKAVYQLVARYADKRDSLAASVWSGVLHASYASSPLVANADEMLAAVHSWRATDDVAEAGPRPRTSASGRTPAVTRPASGAKPATARPATATAKPATTTAKPSTAKPATTSGTTRVATARPTSTTAAATRPAATHDSSTHRTAPRAADSSTSAPAAAASVRGYALQVGVYPTKSEAQQRAAALKTHNLSAVALPKVINGSKQYALVVGRYASVAEAQQKKAAISRSCGCTAFVVRVQ